MAFFDKPENTSGALVARLGVDSTSIRGAVGDQVGILVQNLVSFSDQHPASVSGSHASILLERKQRFQCSPFYCIIFRLPQQVCGEITQGLVQSKLSASY